MKRLIIAGAICTLAVLGLAQPGERLRFAPGISVGRQAILEGLATLYLPRIAEALGVADDPAPIEVSLTEAPSAPPGVTLGRAVTLSAPYMQRKPEDAGMVLHEFTHVVQGYPGGTTPSWLVEGIADYVRDYVILPEPTRWVDPAQADYRKGYTHAATLLQTLIMHHHAGDYRALLVPLNAACRRGEDGAAWLEAHYGPLAQLEAEMRQKEPTIKQE